MFPPRLGPYLAIKAYFRLFGAEFELLPNFPIKTKNKVNWYFYA